MNRLSPHLRIWLSSLFKLVGLILSFSVFIILMAQVWYDVTYDRNLPGSDRIYVFERPTEHIGDPAPYEILFNRPQIEALRSASDQIEAYVTLEDAEILPMISEDEMARDIMICATDTGLPDVFSFRLLSGSFDSFGRPDGVVLTASTARRLLGKDVGAVGEQVMMFNGRDRLPYEVIAVCQDFPDNHSLARFGIFSALGDRYLHNNDPNYEGAMAYFRLRKGTSPAELAPLMADAFVRNWVLWEDEDTRPDIRDITLRESRLVPLHEVHYDHTLRGTGDRTRDIVLTVIALLFLLVALLNLFNLSMALLPFSIRQTNIRIIFGADRDCLRWGEILKAMLVCLVAFGLSLLVIKAVAASPLASMLTVALEPGKLVPVLTACLGVMLLGSAVAAWIPARYGSSFQPEALLKGRVSQTGRGRAWRTATLVFQYILSYVFIVVGLMIGIQNRFTANYDLGFRTKDVLYAYMGFYTAQQTNRVVQEFSEDPNIEGIAFADAQLLYNDHRQEVRQVEGETVQFAGLDVSPAFPDLLGVEVVDGRGFQPEDGERPTGSYLVNEAFLRAYPTLHVGSFMKGIRTGSPDTEAQIVGVVRDFHFEDLTHPVTPYAFYCSGEPGPSPRYFRLVIKAAEGASGTVAENLVSRLEAISGNRQGNAARYENLEETARKFYADNLREGHLVGISSALSLVLALLGILGLIFLEVQTIRKGVAVRKVLGATTGDLMRHLFGDYLLLSSVAFAASIPLIVIVLRRWLEQFAEQATVPVWIFAVAWLLVTALTLLTVSTMLWQVSRTNPVEELKKE